MLKPATEMVDAWVVYQVGSGYVREVHLRVPDQRHTPLKSSGYAVLQTTLSKWALNRTHQLQVRHGKVVNAVSLGGM